MTYILSFIVAFGVTAIAGQILIPALRRLKAGQSIREDGPTWHLSKQGTPTMGGLMFILGIGTAVLTAGWEDLQNGLHNHLVVFLFALVFGAIGFVDDLQKLRHHANEGLTAPQKFLLQLAAAVLFLVLLRRSGAEEEPGEKKLTFDKLVIDLDSYELLVDGRKIDTPPKELELLYHLASTPNRVYTRNQLLDEVWGFDYFGDSRTVDVHIKRLREKVEGVSDQWELKTVWGVGYKFEVK